MTQQNNTNRNSKNVLKYLNQVTGKNKVYIVLLVIIQSVLGICSVYYALCLRNLVNEAVSKNLAGFKAAVYSFCMLVVFMILCRAVNRYLGELSRVNIENCFKKRLFTVLFKKEYGVVSAVHSAKWMNELTSDTVVIANEMTQLLPGLTGMIVKLAGALVVILSLEPAFAYLIIPGGIVLIIFSYSFRKKLKKLHKDVQEKDGDLRVLFQDYMSSMAIVRSYAKEESVCKETEEAMKEHKKVRMRRNHFSNFCNIGFGTLMNGTYVAGAAYCGYGILKGTMTYGTLTAVIQLIAQIQAPMSGISGFVPSFYAMIASAERIMEAEKLKDASDEKPLEYDKIHEFYQNSFQEIGLSHVDFAYPGENIKVLEDFSFHMKKGEFTAFTGTSGCGKSSILKLILGLYLPEKGKCYIKTEKEELDNVHRYQKLFAYVPQGNYLMSGTIREIVSFAEKDAMYDEKRMSNALKIACADEFIDELELGVETVLGERGAGLSEGQMQRLAVARAIFSQSPILLLDECTSALDESTEMKLLENLRDMTDKTVLIITHRPAALKVCNCILNFTEGGCDEKRMC